MKSLIIYCISTFIALSGYAQINNSNYLNNIPGTYATADTVGQLDSAILVIFQDLTGNYWFGSDGRGVYCLTGSTLLHYSAKQGLTNGRVREIKQDSSGAVMVGTLENIFKFDGHAFTRLVPVECDKSINSWQNTSGDVWFHSSYCRNGPYRYNGQTLYHLQLPRSPFEGKLFWDSNPAISAYDVYNIYKDRQGNVWFGTGAAGLCRYNGKTLSWMYEERQTLTPSGGSFGIRSMAEDNEGKLWICNNLRQYHIDPANAADTNNRILKYCSQIGTALVSGHDEPIYCMTILPGKANDIWMTTYSDGIWRFDGKKMKHYPVLKDGKKALLYSMYRDNRGQLWVGTHNKGVYKFNGHVFQPFNPK